MPSRDSEWRVSANRLHRACDSAPGNFLIARLRLLAPRLSKDNPPGGSTTPGGLLRARALGRGDARNIDGTGIQHMSKRGLSASGHKCGVIEGASVSWNFSNGRRLGPRLPFLPMKNPPERGCSGGSVNRWRLQSVIRSKGRAHTIYRVADFACEIPQTIERAACRSSSQLQSWRPPGFASWAHHTAGGGGAK